jgi:hypothetical protein
VLLLDDVDDDAAMELDEGATDNIKKDDSIISFVFIGNFYMWINASMDEIAIIPTPPDPVDFFIVLAISSNLSESTMVTMVCPVEHDDSASLLPLPTLTFSFSFPKSFESYSDNTASALPDPKNTSTLSSLLVLSLPYCHL